MLNRAVILSELLPTPTSPHPMVSDSAKEVFIQGLTQDGKTFRPSDWAERLAGVMSQFRPGGARPGSHMTYSPWCVPTSVSGVRCVIVHTDLHAHNVMAWDFVMNFAKDNELQVHQGEPPHAGAHAHHGHHHHQKH